MGRYRLDEVAERLTPLGDVTYKKMFGNFKSAAKTAWCAIFVTWVLVKAGVKPKHLPQVGPAWATNWGKNKGLHQNPRPGDIVVFGDPSKSGHVEIVTEVHRNGGDEAEAMRINVAKQQIYEERGW